MFRLYHASDSQISFPFDSVNYFMRIINMVHNRTDFNILFIMYKKKIHTETMQFVCILLRNKNKMLCSCLPKFHTIKQCRI